jgi:DNA helicase-4
MQPSSSVAQLLDTLIDHWRFWDQHEEFYLKTLAPFLLENPSKGDETERNLLGKLRAVLNDAEWYSLPVLISERRAEIQREIVLERLRKEAEEKKRRERECIEAQRREEEQQEQLLQEAHRHKIEARRAELIREIRRLFNVDYLAADSFFTESCTDLISPYKYEQEKVAFVKDWVAQQTPPDKSGIRRIPADEQAAAIAAVHGHIQVVARAGSGKTTTLVGRALFLQKHCAIPAGEMLLLAFNRKASFEIRKKLLIALNGNADAALAQEINQRIKGAKNERRIDIEEIGTRSVDAVAERLGVALPHVMTFHALAYALVHPEESILYNDPLGGNLGLSRVIQCVIDDHLQVPAFKAKMRELMLAHFREDWDRIVEGCYDKSRDELLQLRRSLPRECLGGDYVKSFGEKVIADFLFEHDVAYKYEHNHWWSGTNYRPDFTIFKTQKTGVVIEYFGLDGDPDYDEMTLKKRKFWLQKKDWTLIEFSPLDIAACGTEVFKAQLKASLEKAGISCNRLSEDEIWHRVRERAIDRFTSATVGFIGRCRKRSLPPKELAQMVQSYTSLSSVEGMFLEMAQTIYWAYLVRLTETGDEDFDGLMKRAADLIAGGGTVFDRKYGRGDLATLRYMFVDEFQDFSELFYRLFAAIRKQNLRVELFAVGDDWQAINGFAGSDLKFFEHFDHYIGDSRRLYISTNYRSARSIVGIGNALMAGLGKPAMAVKNTPGQVLLADVNDFKPAHLELERHPGDVITPIVLRLASAAIAKNFDVVLLCRQNRIPWFVNYQVSKDHVGRGLEIFLNNVRKYFPKEKRELITISTSHKYKGLEKPVVIVLDAVARSYPLIHPDWVFSRILGDSLDKIIKEERRLFYVALTRAIQQLIVITDEKSKSAFLYDIEVSPEMQPIDWTAFPPLCVETNQRLVVRIGSQDHRSSSPTFTIKDFLKASGYQFQSTGWKSWVKTFPIDDFTIEVLKNEVWAEKADGVEIKIFNDREKITGHYIVNSGEWHCIKSLSLGTVL